MTKDNKSKIKPVDLMYYLELISSDSEQTNAFRLEAILLLLKTSGYIKDYKI